MLRAIALAALLACAGPARAGTVPLPGDADAVAIGPHAETLKDAEGRLTLSDVLAREREFARLKVEIPNFGYSYAAHWLRFRLPQDTSRLLVPMLILEIRFPSIDSIELQVPYRSAAGVEYRLQRGGDQLPFEAREVKHRNHVFRIPTTGLAVAPTYLRVASESVLTVPAYLWQPQAFIEHDRHAQLVLGLFYGLVFALMLYNLMLFFSVRDRVYFYYVIYAAAFSGFLLAYDGLAFQYLWPESVWWANHGLATALALTLAFGALFALRFLDISRSAPRAWRPLQGIALVSGTLSLFAASGWLLSYGEILRTLSVLGLAAAALASYAALRAILAGFRPAQFFLFAWGALLVFIALGALRNFALVPTNFVTINGLHIGFALDVLLLSFALADRINVLKREKDFAQAAALAGQQALLEATRASGRELERGIAERTAELNCANERLREEASEREQLMLQLREQEQHLRHMAQHDPLTGLPNRLSMQERLALQMELAKRNRKKLAVMLVDLNDFKRINDTRGHVAGDHALAAIAGRLRTSVRGSDTVARYGGDEFVVLAGELDRAADAGYIAEKIADMVRMPIPIDGATERVSCSIGISVFPDDAEDAEGLIDRADRAMYASKSAADRRYAYFSAT